MTPNEDMWYLSLPLFNVVNNLGTGKKKTGYLGLFRQEGVIVIEEATVRTGQDMESENAKFIIFRKCYKSIPAYVM